MSIISRLLSGRDAKPKNAKTTATNPYRISRPVAGFVCFEPALQSLMETDKSSLGPLFSEVHSSSEGIVPCHVLFLYCKVDRDGSLPGLNMRIRDLVKASGACVAIVASENDGNHYMHALQPKNDWPANIVLVIDRRGAAFTVFFHKLFEAMKGGTSMLMAWVKLAPQIPNRDQPECPSTLMLAEAGHIALS
jgi:hypothetical protein